MPWYVLLNQINAKTAQINFDHKFMKEYNILYPYQMREFVDLYDIPECQCPRVYWPICANDNITYVNHCILNCNKDKNGGMRRYGPCVHYRRSMMSFVEVVLPKTWENAPNNDTVEKLPQYVCPTSCARCARDDLLLLVRAARRAPDEIHANTIDDKELKDDIEAEVRNDKDANGDIQSVIADDKEEDNKTIK
ncbi:hypothetical protein MSG28_012755 [Choristoneura fumiferana]|uniref:Uncharacterized protein n=1 Tax=Choristoneura fumiferana TaxID=7141 RepID=A0ACC0JHZ9_CHOFU|nr:hypothetical protein MSG28_012755 [Choristoneura fumiferana]